MGPAWMNILGPLMIPVTGLLAPPFNVAPLSQFCCGWFPASLVTSWSLSSIAGQLPESSGVHPWEDPPSARGRSDLTICGATYGSGCHQLAISGSETGGERSRLLFGDKTAL